MEGKEKNLIEKTARAIRLINCISRINLIVPSSKIRFTWAVVNTASA